MKKSIILSGSLLLIIVMLITPTIPAMEYKTMKEKIQSDSYMKLEGIRKNIEKMKSLVKNFNINFKLLLMILIRGILLPLLGLTITYITTSKIWEVYPVIAVIIMEIMLMFTMKFTLIPLLNIILAETGNYLLSLIIYILLGITDISLFIIIIRYINNNPGINTSVSGFRNSVKSSMNVV